uniref:FSA_C domain-containing protein n=1 Tax=Steinernema glaseri TaxID=37863 RepID=A0A1I7YVV6_9BILA
MSEVPAPPHPGRRSRQWTSSTDLPKHQLAADKKGAHYANSWVEPQTVDAIASNAHVSLFRRGRDMKWEEACGLLLEQHWQMTGGMERQNIATAKFGSKQYNQGS